MAMRMLMPLLGVVCLILINVELGAGEPLQQRPLRSISAESSNSLQGHADAGASSPWCRDAAHPAADLSWEAIPVPGRSVLGKQDVHTCSILQLPPAADPSQSYVRTALQQHQGQPGMQLYQVLLLDCDASFWQLANIEHQEHVCLANTAALRAACNQWLLSPPAGQLQSADSCAPPSTAFARAGDVSHRVLVLQAHWRMPASLTDTAVQLPQLTLKLGATPAPAVAAESQPAAPATPLLGMFVGSGVYPPSSLSRGLQAFKVPAAGSAGGVASAELSCGKRCTYLNLGRLRPQTVNVVGYSFSTFDRATAVAIEIKRGAAGKAAGPVVLEQSHWQDVKAAGGLVTLGQPLQLYPGDIMKWRCSYNTSGSTTSSIVGGYSASDGSHEQCTMMLHYWPRVESMRGCIAATLTDPLLGENMCSHEALDLLRITGIEDKEFPMRRMYQEHSFPKGSWMGAWKATHLVLLMGLVLATLWGSQTILRTCKGLGVWHQRFRQLEQGQQRNVSLYITHLLLDTLVLGCVFQPMIELWMGWTETTADVRAGEWAFVYIIACYALELTWRRSIDTMLAIHHIGTITIILLYAGEFAAQTYRVANNIIVLAAFALMEQPTYIALLCKRMLPAHSPFVVTAARFGCISWFILKGLSAVIAFTMFVEDWHLMPMWIKVNFTLTWVVAFLVQGWSGLIQYSIYKQIRRSFIKSNWQYQQEQLKRRTAAVLAAGADGYGMCPAEAVAADSKFAGACSNAGSDEGGEQGLQVLTPLLSPVGSEGSDCIPTGADEGQEGKLSERSLSGNFSPSGSGSMGEGSGVTELVGFEKGASDTSCAVAAADARRPQPAGAGDCSAAAAGGSGACHLAGPAAEGQQQRQRAATGRQVRLQLTQRHSSSGSSNGSSSSAQLSRNSEGLQRRSKSGLLNLMECGLPSQPHQQ